jgi:iron complex transport system substrate-binding protein
MAEIALKDLAGRSMVLSNPAQRLVAIGPGTLRLLAYCRIAERVIGVEAIEQRDYAGRPYTLANRGHFAHLPVFGQGGPGKPVDKEALLRLKPDLVLANALEPADADRLAREIRAPVALISYGEDGIFDEQSILSSLRLIGQATGSLERAEALIATYLTIKDDLARRTKGLAHRPSVYVGAVGYKGMHGIASTQAQFLPLRLLGADNVADALSAKPKQLFVDREQLLVWNPDYVFVDAGGLSMVSEESRKTPQFYRALKAFAGGRAYTTLPYNYYATNLEIALSDAYFIGKQIYPDRFSDVDPHREAERIVKAFVGVSVLDEVEANYSGFARLILQDGVKAIAPDR